MHYTNLGRTGLTVSRICLGTMNFGPRTTEEDSFAIMDKAIEVGINFFDTANIYGGPVKGATETIVGNWLTKSGKRDDIVLATKCYIAMGEGKNDRGLSAYNIKRACEASLKRLQTDHIDLYQMHHVDRNTPWEEIWQAMDQLVTEGKISYVGSSNFGGWHIAQGCEKAKQRNSLGLVCEQSLFNLRERRCEMEVLPACREYGLGFIAWSPLAGGMLADVLNYEAAENTRRAGDHIEGRIEERRAQYEAWEIFCKDLGEELANVALAWVLAQPGVTGPIIGPRTMEQLTGCLRALDIELSEDHLKRIDEIWPGTGPAPEAYAW